MAKEKPEERRFEIVRTSVDEETFMRLFGSGALGVRDPQAALGNTTPKEICAAPASPIASQKEFSSTAEKHMGSSQALEGSVPGCERPICPSIQGKENGVGGSEDASSLLPPAQADKMPRGRRSRRSRS